MKISNGHSEAECAHTQQGRQFIYYVREMIDNQVDFHHVIDDFSIHAVDV